MDVPLTPPDLTSCDREPIHTPGSCQPHGMMLVLDRDAFRVRHVAGDIEQRLGIVAWEGQLLSVLIGDFLGATVATPQ